MLDDASRIAVLASLVAGFSTLLGALPALAIRSLGVLSTSLLLAFGAGVMLSATAFSLVAPALELHAELGLPFHPLMLSLDALLA